MSQKKEKTTKKKSAEERVPKHVSIRLSYRDYLRLVEIGDVAAKMKESKDVKKAVTSAINEFSDDLNADKFLGLIAGLHAKERTLERFYSQPPRDPPTRMYFTDPEKCTKEVSELHEVSKKWTKGKLRYDQKKETCPTDVRVMFYAYIRGKELVEDGKPDITIDKFLKKVAPNTLSKLKHIKRGNSSLIWEICSEIRGSKPKEPKKGRKKVVESEDESEDEEPKKGRKKVIESSEEESDESSSEEEEAPKKTKRR
ncbi:hypothetical protein BGZ91_002436 [Linnemannia elongata]|nr:hypothetical protein BGZ91_002436 [Linnemannia elongata]